MPPKRAEGVVKKIKPSKNAKAPTQPVTTLKNAGSTAYWGYKAFQGVRMCSGDVTALAELGAELLSEGVLTGVVANPTIMVDAIENIVSLNGGVKSFRKNVTNFAQFSQALALQLNSSGNTKGGASMESAERIYKMFMECDRDGSGGVSMEEYLFFCHKEGVPKSMAETMFFQADIDGNGQISFEEWTSMMVGRIGRDKDSFNCGGHHGLTQYNAPFNGLECDFCKGPILAGSLASGCRRCDCDACAKCCGFSRAHPQRPPSFDMALGAKAPSVKVPPPLPPTDSGGKFDCRGRHGLTLTVVPTTRGCDWCRRAIPAGSLVVECRMCNCDGCMDCVAGALVSFCVSSLTCPGRHGLTMTRTPSPGYGCDFCACRVAAGTTMYNCRICQVDACVSCMWKDHRRALSTGGAFACHGNHQLRWLHITNYHDMAHKCDWCLGHPLMGARMLRCDVCNVDVCNACIASGSMLAQRPPEATRRVGVPQPVAQPMTQPVAQPSAKAAPPPPPSYHEIDSPPHGSSYQEDEVEDEILPPPRASREKITAPPPAGAVPRRARPPPSYHDLEDSSCSPERDTPAVNGKGKVADKPPFRFDAIVRVCGVYDEELNNKLMTVIAFEPDTQNGGDGPGVVVLRRRGKVVRVSPSCVFNVVD